MTDVDRMPATRLASSINAKHREVVDLGRTAKEIGEELVAVKQKLAHGEFKPWVEANCTFVYRRAAEYMQVAKVKSASCRTFEQADSIRDVLDHKAPKPEPAKVHRAATLDDLRKVEHMRPAEKCHVCHF